MEKKTSRAQASVEFTFPDPMIARELVMPGEDDGAVDFTAFIMAVGNGMLDREILSGPFAQGGTLHAHAPWLMGIVERVAVQVRDALGFEPGDGLQLALQMRIEPLEKERFRLNVSVSYTETPRPGEESASEQLTFLGEIPAIAPAPQGGDRQTRARRSAPQDYVIVPSNLLYQHTRSAISAGHEGLFAQREEGDRWPTHHVRRPTFQADMSMQPRSVLPQGLLIGQIGYEELMQKMRQSIDKLDDLGADVFDIISAKWIEANPKSPGDMVTLTADDFLSMRGLLSNPGGGGYRGGYKDTQRAEIAQRIASLDQLWIDVREMPATVIEDGRRRRRKIRLQTKAVVVSMQAGEVNEQDGVNPFAWRIRPGDGFTEILLSTVGRETALMALRALSYHPENQYMEKRLTRYLSVQWRVRQSRADYLAPYRVDTLLAAINEQPDARRPARQRERLEAALDRLHKDAVIAAWQYEDGCDEAALPARGWQDAWLLWRVVIEPPERICARYARIDEPSRRPRVPTVRAAQIALDAAAQPLSDIARRIRDARKARGFTQLQLAEVLSVNRASVAQVESGKRTPSVAFQRKLDAWLGEE